MTTNSLKETLYQSLDKKGVLENLKVNNLFNKAQLRSKLLSNVLSDKKPSSKAENIKLQTKTINIYEDENINLVKITCSLFSDFLKKNNLTYTQSVFIPEIGINDLYSENELLGHFNDKFKNFESKDSAIIINILMNINKFNINKNVLESKLSQTDVDTNLDIEEKFRLIDSKYLSKIDIEKLMPSKLTEEKNLKYQRELEARLRNDMQKEVLSSNNCRYQG